MHMDSQQFALAPCHPPQVVPPTPQLQQMSSSSNQPGVQIQAGGNSSQSQDEGMLNQAGGNSSQNQLCQERVGKQWPLPMTPKQWSVEQQSYPLESTERVVRKEPNPDLLLEVHREKVWYTTNTNNGYRPVRYRYTPTDYQQTGVSQTKHS